VLAHSLLHRLPRLRSEVIGLGESARRRRLRFGRRRDASDGQQRDENARDRCRAHERADFAHGIPRGATPTLALTLRRSIRDDMMLRLVSASVPVQVRYFAVLRERAGREAEAFELPAGAIVKDARDAIAARHPDMAPLLSRIAIAVNHTVVADGHPLSAGDEVALLPPVSGG
jgi:molybdopterin converting factor subunit 1